MLTVKKVHQKYAVKISYIASKLTVILITTCSFECLICGPKIPLNAMFIWFQSTMNRTTPAMIVQILQILWLIRSETTH